MFTIFLQWVLQPKNAIITALSVLLLVLGGYNKYLKYESNKQEITINSLNKEVFNLKSNIQLQNDSIKKMNDSFELQKQEFEKNYKDLQVKNKSKIESIKKQEIYVSPANVITTTDEVNESRKLIQDFKNGRVK